MQRSYQIFYKILGMSLIIAMFGLLPIISAQEDTQPLWIVAFDGTLRGASWSPDGDTVLTWADWQDQEKPARLWSADDGIELWTRSELINGAQWKADSSLVLTWGGVKAEIWERETGEATLTIEPGTRLIRAGWSPDETMIYTHAFDGTVNQVQVWSAEDGHEILYLEFNNLVKSVVWHPDSQQIVTARGPKPFAIQVWNVADGVELQSIEYSEFVYDVRWDAETSRLLGRTELGTILAWSVDNGEVVLMLENNAPIIYFHWKPDGTQALLSFSIDEVRMVVLWDLVAKTKIVELPAIPTLNQPIWVDGVPYWVIVVLQDIVEKIAP